MRSSIIGLTLAVLCGNTFATTMQATFTGHITGKPLGSPQTEVMVNDVFSFTTQFDDANSISGHAFVNGDLYTKISNSFDKGLTAFSGSLGREIVNYNAPDAGGNLAGWGNAEYFYGPDTVLKGSIWAISSGTFSNDPLRRGYSLSIVTGFGGVVGWGQYFIGAAFDPSNPGATIDHGYFSLDSVAITPVPEPLPSTLYTAGLLILMAVGLRKRLSL